MKIVIAAAAALALSIPNIFATSQYDAFQKMRTITSNYICELIPSRRPTSATIGLMAS
jgi:hypothetical protein